MATALLLCGLLALCAPPTALAGIPVPRNAEGLPTLAPVLREVTPAVVNISVTARSPQMDNPLLRDPFFRHFFNLPRGRPERSQAAGSGVIVDAGRGRRLLDSARGRVAGCRSRQEHLALRR